MPPWLVDLLKDEGQVVNDGESYLVTFLKQQLMTLGVLPVLSQLLEQSPSTQYAYLCHPAVQHVSKLRREGESTNAV
jgi:zinc finger-containing ubiquitin peptidase 1